MPPRRPPDGRRGTGLDAAKAAIQAKAPKAPETPARAPRKAASKRASSPAPEAPADPKAILAAAPPLDPASPRLGVHKEGRKLGGDPAPAPKRKRVKAPRPKASPAPAPEGTGDVVDLDRHPMTKARRAADKRSGGRRKAEPPAIPVGPPKPSLAIGRQDIIERLVSEGVERGRATLYADLFLEYAEAHADIAANGVFITGPRGGLSENPWVHRRDWCRKAFLEYRNVDAAWLWDMLT